MDDFSIMAWEGRSSLHTVLASRLFKAGQLSPGRAAKLAGMSLAAFYEYVSAQGIDVVDYDPAELDAELTSFD